ncbi:MAG: NAD(P)-binding protein, partial [Gemmatimonadetes bacterium]|nr:NAD(P)-binding protein [Gemmatimonadota bacterium]NIU78452.1 NAD(P)-binding protein [Gammaproteobacteria bacterium]NIX47357.1 NAD(P)-binding protein [Gemmatimonadota bacterium]NIY11728.1 NAD(P)-binding protein [Gemmatimonadota bacterium]
MSDRYDVIVIGAGHNGLTAAALLARAGRKTLVLERRAVVGGIAAGEEFHPGYRTDGLLHDTAGVRPWVVDELGLEKHGLQHLDTTPPVLVPRRDGEAFLLWRDAGRAGEEIRRLSPADAERYGEYRAFLDRIAPVLRRLLDNPPPDIFEPGAGDLLRLGRYALSLRRLGKADMMEVLRIAPMPLA